MISVIICTFNRVGLLEETVRSFLACQADGIDYELLLVDNNSTDKTRELAESLTTQNPRIRYLFEPHLSLCHARNTGVRESRGEIITFADDDVYFSPRWLTSLYSSFERHPDVACIGGKVVPHFETGRPSWIDDDQLWIYGVTRYGDHEREIQPPEIPIGCNMAFRRTVFEQIGGFNPSLGRKGGSLQSGEENDLFIRAGKAGLKTLYSPDVKISHRIPPARTTRNWVLRRYYWQGASDIVLNQIAEGSHSQKDIKKKAIETLRGLLRRWKEIAGFLSENIGSKSCVTTNNQLDICYKIGALRQMIVESLKVPGGDAVNSERRGEG